MTERNHFLGKLLNEVTEYKTLLGPNRDHLACVGAEMSSLVV